MRQRNYFDIFFTLSLMCVFVLCSTLLLFFQIDRYEQQKLANDTQASKRLVQSYLTMNFHQRRSSQTFEIIQLNGIDCFQISDETHATTTLIYAYDGYMRELYQDINATVDITTGDKIAPLEKMQVTQDGQLYTFSLLQEDAIELLHLQTY